jgi:exopolyphosphatase/guanosine-5'-triphosphate,3'-diphosphate pyrophosphatase
MAKPIVARWEWRTFGSGFDESEARIRKFEQGNYKESEEEYVLSRNSDENVKVRDDLLDIKSLQQVNADGLEQWFPVLKAGFPIPVEDLKNVFSYFKTPEPIFGRKEYSFDQFLKEIVQPNQNLRLVHVKKKRAIYVINGAVVEIAETDFDGVALKTICVEHEDPDIVLKTVRELALESLPNINYIQAMKKTVGMA